MAKRRPKSVTKCKSMLALFDEIENTHQTLFEKISRALTIRNDEEAVRKILREMKDLLA